MMHRIGYEYTDKKISPWGGILLINEFYKRTGLRQALDVVDLPQPRSNRGYNPIELVEQFWVSAILGAKRIAHTAQMRVDEVLPEVWNWGKGIASQSTFSRFFRKFDFERNTEVFTKLNKSWFGDMKLRKVTIDLDSTVLHRYGQQEGVAKGYNPSKRGHGSHHPIMAFIAESKMCLNGWMRAGNTHSSTDIVEFLEETIDILPQGKIGLLRGDSGFYNHKIFKLLESRTIKYVVVAKFYSRLVDKIIEITDWVKTSDGVECSELYYQGTYWNKARRIVVVRKDNEKYPKSGGKFLFKEVEDLKRYKYSVFVTNEDDLPAEHIWRLYRHRADAENRIRELKQDYGIDGFAFDTIEATEAAFRFILIIHNLISLFKQSVTKSKHLEYLSTLKYKCIAIGSYLISRNRKPVLKLAVHKSKRAWIDSLFLRIGGLDPPFQISNE